MKSRSKSEKSRFEKTFQNQKVLKRNKQYIDLAKINKEEKSISFLRRIPLKSEGNHVDEKINFSFMNTTTDFTERTHRSKKTKSRISFFGGTQETPRDVFSEEKRIIYGKRHSSFSIGKMTSREYHHNLRVKPIPDERIFNNFEKFHSSKTIFCEFSKSPERKLDSGKILMKDIDLPIERLQEHYFFSTAPFKTKVNYQLENKQKSQRVFFSEKKPENVPATDLNPELVDKCKEKFSHFKGNNLQKGDTEIFYNVPGRDVPSQTEMRRMNELTNHYKTKDRKIKRVSLDYIQRKQKEDLENERMLKIEFAKKPRNVQEENCDLKFFRRFVF